MPLKNYGKCKKHSVIKLATIEIKKNYLVSEPNYCTIKFLNENLLAIKI